MDSIEAKREERRRKREAEDSACPVVTHYGEEESEMGGKINDSND